MRPSEGTPFKTCANPQIHNQKLNRANRYENKGKKWYEQHQRIFWTIRGGYRVITQQNKGCEAKESSPERSAKSLSRSFFVLPFLSPKIVPEPFSFQENAQTLMGIALYIVAILENEKKLFSRSGEVFRKAFPEKLGGKHFFLQLELFCLLSSLFAYSALKRLLDALSHCQ